MENKNKDIKENRKFIGKTGNSIYVPIPKNCGFEYKDVVDIEVFEGKIIVTKLNVT